MSMVAVAVAVALVVVMGVMGVVKFFLVICFEKNQLIFGVGGVPTWLWRRAGDPGHYL